MGNDLLLQKNEVPNLTEHKSMLFLTVRHKRHAYAFYNRDPELMFYVVLQITFDCNLIVVLM